MCIKRLFCFRCLIRFASVIFVLGVVYVKHPPFSVWVFYTWRNLYVCIYVLVVLYEYKPPFLFWMFDTFCIVVSSFRLNEDVVCLCCVVCVRFCNLVIFFFWRVQILLGRKISTALFKQWRRLFSLLRVLLYLRKKGFFFFVFLEMKPLFSCLWCFLRVEYGFILFYFILSLFYIVFLYFVVWIFCKFYSFVLAVFFVLNPESGDVLWLILYAFLFFLLKSRAVLACSPQSNTHT
jgi:hypothetical protein